MHLVLAGDQSIDVRNTQSLSPSHNQSPSLAVVLQAKEPTQAPQDTLNLGVILVLEARIVETCITS